MFEQLLPWHSSQRKAQVLEVFHGTYYLSPFCTVTWNRTIAVLPPGTGRQFYGGLAFVGFPAGWLTVVIATIMKM